MASPIELLRLDESRTVPVTLLVTATSDSDQMPVGASPRTRQWSSRPGAVTSPLSLAKAQSDAADKAEAQATTDR